MEDAIEVPADAVLNELVNAGIVTQQVLQLAANKIAMQIQLERMQGQMKSPEPAEQESS